ncbi:MAG: DUF1570 domain-containing protein [Isosphaeraceae bacterium]|nr:DUF1570 domain-containing protein [Isosphaeraceae bacterium]
MRPLVIVALLGLATPAPADLLYFARGGRAELPADVDGESVRVQAPSATLTFRKSDFSSIVDRPTVAQEWPTRLEKARKGSPDDRFAAAWWALENGLTPEACTLIRAVHAEDPTHGAAARLAAMLDRIDRELPLPADLDEIETISGTRLQRETGRIAVVFHQDQPALARRRLEVVERVAVTFLLVFTARGMELAPPPHKLVSLWYADQNAYIAFLNRSDAGAFRSTQGYYHPTRGIVAGYDAAAGEAHLKARSGLDLRRRELDLLERTVDALKPGMRASIRIADEPARIVDRARASTLLETARRELARAELMLELDQLSADLGVTAHETVHQMVMSTGLARDHETFPTWLNEGLATQFEAVRGGIWAGYGRLNDRRLPDFRSQLPGPRLAPLLRDDQLRRGYRRETYAQAWALVHYLRVEHPDRFITLLDRLRIGRPAGSGTPGAEAVTAFRETIGELTDIEPAWHRHFRAATTPLEEFAPDRNSPMNRR